MPATKHLTRPQVAAMFGVSARSISIWCQREKDPLPVAVIDRSSRGNRYDAAAVFEWGVRQRLREAESNQPDGNGPADYNFERARLTRAKAEQAELELAEQKGKLLDAGLVEKALVGMLTNFRARILAMPSKAGPKCLAAEDAAEARAILKSYCHEALHELASRGIGEAVEADLISDIERTEDGPAAT